MSLYTLIFKRSMSERRFIFMLIASLFCAIIVLVALFEYFAATILMPNMIGVNSEYLIELQKDTIRAVALGSSHTDGGLTIDDPILFNYAKAGDNTPLFYFQTKHIIDRLNIKLLLLEFDYHTFGAGYANPNNTYDRHLYAIDEPVSADLGRYILGTNRSLLPSKNYINPIVLISQFAKYLRGNLDINKALDGHGSYPGRLDQLPKAERVEQGRNSALGMANDQFIVDGLVYWYEKTIRLAQENNITVVLIGYPFSGNFLEFFPQEQSDKFDRLAQTLIDKYNIEFWNYRRLFVDRDDLMRDAGHISIEGQRELTKLIKPRIEKILNEKSADENEWGQ